MPSYLGRRLGQVGGDHRATSGGLVIRSRPFREVTRSLSPRRPELPLRPRTADTVVPHFEMEHLPADQGGANLGSTTSGRSSTPRPRERLDAAGEAAMRSL